TDRCLGGRPLLRLYGRITPFMKSCPPQTPHGSRRSRAPCKQGSTTGQEMQIDFALAMSSICSEKNRSTREPSSSRQAATVQSTGRVHSSIEPSSSCWAIISPFPFWCFGTDPWANEKAAGWCRRPWGLLSVWVLALASGTSTGAPRPHGGVDATVVGKPGRRGRGITTGARVTESAGHRLHLGPG